MGGVVEGRQELEGVCKVQGASVPGAAAAVAAPLGLRGVGVGVHHAAQLGAHLLVRGLALAAHLPGAGWRAGGAAGWGRRGAGRAAVRGWPLPRLGLAAAKIGSCQG